MHDYDVACLGHPRCLSETSRLEQVFTSSGVRETNIESSKDILKLNYLSATDMPRKYSGTAHVYVYICVL